MLFGQQIVFGKPYNLPIWLLAHFQTLKEKNPDLQKYVLDLMSTLHSVCMFDFILSLLMVFCNFAIADIVFFIALYQRWIYPIDPKRVNEFGTTGEPVDNAAVVANQEPKETKAIENGTTEAEMATDKKND